MYFFLKNKAEVGAALNNFLRGHRLTASHYPTRTARAWDTSLSSSAHCVRAPPSLYKMSGPHHPSTKGDPVRIRPGPSHLQVQRSSSPRTAQSALAQIGSVALSLWPLPPLRWPWPIASSSRAGTASPAAAGGLVIVEWNVAVSVVSDCLPSYTSDDNSAIVATDSIKNTVSPRSLALPCLVLESGLIRCGCFVRSGVCEGQGMHGDCLHGGIRGDSWKAFHLAVPAGR